MPKLLDILPKRYWYVILTYAIMQFSGLVFARLLYQLTPLSAVDASIYWTIFSFLAALVIVLRLMRPDIKAPAHPQASPVWESILWAIAGLCMAYFANVASSLIEKYIFGINPASENTEEIMAITQAAPLFMVITALVAPILEEIIFRKIIFGELYKRTSFLLAAVLSSLAFGLIHGEPQHILVYGSMGFVFAFLYFQTKRIIVPIIVHMSLNTVTVIGQLLLGPENIEKMMKQLDNMQMILMGG